MTPSNLDLARECGAYLYACGQIEFADQAQLDAFAERIRADERASIALPAGMPKPDAYMFQHEETGLVQFVDAQQVEWGFEESNPRLKRIDAVYTAAQVQTMLAHGAAPQLPAGQPLPVERKPLTDEQLVACIKLAGFTTWDTRMWALKQQIEAAHGIAAQQIVDA